MPIEFTVPDGAIQARLFVNVELDLQHGNDYVVRCVISDGEIEGETAAETGTVSALLADPNGSAFAAWKQGALEFARKLPEVSQREPAPSDRDPIPAPWDNTYNTAERNRFHYVIKYHRDDDFLVRHVLDDATRRTLDQAWTDLTSSFDYHDVYFRFVVEKYGLDLNGRGIAELQPDQIDRLGTEPRGYVQRLRDDYQQNQRALAAARPGHVEDALRLAERAWRRPLTESERNALRMFYRELRDKSALDHAKAMRALIARIFVAPSFLYRVESPPDEPGIDPFLIAGLAAALGALILFGVWAGAGIKESVKPTDWTYASTEAAKGPSGDEDEEPSSETEDGGPGDDVDEVSE